MLVPRARGTMELVQQRWGGRALAGVAVAAWLLAAAGYAYTIAVHARLDDAHGDLTVDPSEAVVYGAAMLSAATVGLVVAIRQRRHPVGWLFLALALALSVGAAGDAYALEHGVVQGDEGTAAGLALVAGQASFIAWLALVAAVLQLTPTGRPLSRRWGLALAGTAVAASVALASQGGPGHGLRPAVRRHAEPLGVALDRRAGRRRGGGRHRAHDARPGRGGGLARRAVPALATGASASSCAGWR